MKHKTLVRGFAVAGAVALGAGSAWAADLTVVSWGGAYTASQQKAYGEPWFHNGKNIMEHMPNRPEVMARSVLANPEWWADNGDAIKERFDAWRAH